MNLFKKQMIAFLLILVIFATDVSAFSNGLIQEVSAITFDEINAPAMFLKQTNGDLQCTLVAATMLIKRAAMLSGNRGWADITVDKVKSQAWVGGVGLKYTFTYEGITVNKAPFGSDPVKESLQLLQLHPEGIVLYDQIRSPRSHAVLLTDYTNDMFYCADPSDAVPYGRIPISSGLVQVKDAEFYYYVSSPAISPLSTSPSAPGTTSIPVTQGNTNTPVAQENANSPITQENITLPITQENAGISVTPGNTIMPITDINTFSPVLSQTSFYYDGSEKKPAVAITELTENVDYTVLYVNNISPGSAAVIISGIGLYSGTITKSFEIKEVILSDYINEIKAEVTKQTIQKGTTAAIKVTLPALLKSVTEYSVNAPGTYHEIKINYSSGNKKIAVVNSKGVITGKGKGTTKINVTAQLADGTKKVVSFKIKVQ